MRRTDIKGAIKVNKKFDLVVKDLVYTSVEWDIEGTELSKAEKLFYIYSAKAEEGGDTYFLFTEKKLPHKGDVSISVRLMNARKLREDYDFPIRVVNEILKETGLKRVVELHMKEAEKEGLEIGLWASFIEIIEDSYQRPIFLKIIEPVKEIDYQKINFKKFTNAFLKENYNVDENILMAFKGLIPRYSFNQYNLAKIQQTNPHMIIATNPKTGKTTMSEKVGRRYDSIRTSRLLGFADAQDVNKGDLNGRNEPFIADEIQEEEREKIFSQLLTFLETGRSSVGKGKQTINTKSTSPMVFVSNPRMKQIGTLTSSTELLSAFNGFLQKITNNYRAFGSRFGLVLFGKDFDVALKGEEEKQYSEEELDIIKEAMYYIIEENTEQFTRLLLHEETQKWIHLGFTENYRNEVNRIINEIDNEVDSVRLFWEGHLDAHRHVRGLAYRLALVKNLKEIAEGFENELKLLDDADKYFSEICHINIMSMKQMSRARLSEEYIKKLLADIKKNAHINLLFNVVGLFTGTVNIDAYIDERTHITKEDLIPFFDQIKDEASGYKYISNVFHKITKFHDSQLKYLGIEITRDHNKKITGLYLRSNYIR